jgi:hypothetical protein
MTEEFSTIDIVRNNLYDGRKIFRKQIITKLLAEVDTLETSAYLRGLRRAVEIAVTEQSSPLKFTTRTRLEIVVDAIESEIAKEVK